MFEKIVLERIEGSWFKVKKEHSSRALHKTAFQFKKITVRKLGPLSRRLHFESLMKTFARKGRTSAQHFIVGDYLSRGTWICALPDEVAAKKLCLARTFSKV